MADAELKARASLEGGRETAQGLREIDQARRQVAEGETKTAQAAEKGAEAQGKLNASTETYTALASRLHPTLGALVDGMVKSARVAGDWANQQINLREVTNKLTGAIRNNLNALKLMGAAGLVVAGIMAIVKAVRTAREEYERYTGAIKKNQQALNEAKDEEEDLEVAITKVAGSRRRAAPLTDEQARAATGQAKGIMAQFESLDQGAVTQAVGMLAGQGLSRRELADAAMLLQSGRLQFDPQMSPEYMARYTQHVREREEDWLAGERRRETVAGRGMGDISTTGGVRRRSRREEAAFNESRAEGGATRNLAAIMRGVYPDMPEEDAERLAEMAQRFGGRQAFEEQVGRGRASWLPWRWGSERRVLETGRTGWFGFTDEDVSLDPHEIAQMRMLLQRTEGPAPAGGGVRTIIHNHHPRFYGASAGQREESRTGGEHTRDALLIG